MRNGTHVVYCIQYRTFASGEWLKLDSKIKELPEYGTVKFPKSAKTQWSVCGEHWSRSMIPHVGTGDQHRPLNQKAYDQFRDTYRATSYHGWWDAKYAIAALKRIKQDDEKGEYDSRDGYGKLHQRIRHEFRLARLELTYQKKIEPISVDELVEALA